MLLRMKDMNCEVKYLEGKLKLKWSEMETQTMTLEHYSPKREPCYGEVRIYADLRSTWCKPVGQGCMCNSIASMEGQIESFHGSFQCKERLHNSDLNNIHKFLPLPIRETIPRSVWPQIDLNKGPVSNHLEGTTLCRLYWHLHNLSWKSVVHRICLWY